MIAPTVVIEILTVGACIARPPFPPTPPAAAYHERIAFYITTSKRSISRDVRRSSPTVENEVLSVGRGFTPAAISILRKKSKQDKAHRSGTLMAYLHTPKWDTRSNEVLRRYFFATHGGGVITFSSVSRTLSVPRQSGRTGRRSRGSYRYRACGSYRRGGRKRGQIRDAR